MKNLGFDVGRTTVARVLAEGGITEPTWTLFHKYGPVHVRKRAAEATWYGRERGDGVVA